MLDRRLAAAIGTLVTVACCACSTTDAPALPDTWERLSPDRAEDGTTIELRPDGTGTFTSVPVWDGTLPCSSTRTMRYSGEITWTMHDERFMVDAAGTPLVVWGGTGGFLSGSINWGKLLVDVCATKDGAGQDLLAFVSF